MAKGQKRSNREARKPKQARPKVAAATPSVLASVERSMGKWSAGPKDARK